MTLGAKYTTYPEGNFKAAAQRLHNNYSETPWENADYSDRTWAHGTLRGIIEDLGPAVGASEAEERIDSLRQSNIGQSEALSRIWHTLFGNSQPEQSNYGYMTDLIIARIQDEAPQVQVTDEMIHEVGLGLFGPAVVYDREKLRLALANALQTR